MNWDNSPFRPTPSEVWDSEEFLCNLMIFVVVVVVGIFDLAVAAIVEVWALLGVLRPAPKSR